MRRIRRVVLSISVLGAAVAGCSTSEGTGVKTTLFYCSPGNAPQPLDVYTPVPAPSTPVPAVVYVHGGGWVLGGDNLSPFIDMIAQGVIASGAIFVSVDYRLAPRSPWPAQLQDVQCAIRFLRHDANRLRIDPRRIGALGDSAGGQLVSMLGLVGPDAGLDAGPFSTESSSVQAVVDLYGPADLTNSDWAGNTLMQTFAHQEFGQALGHPTPVLASASPVDHVGPGDPQFLIIQGSDDTVVPPHQSQELASRLRAKGDTAVLVMVHGGGHALVPAGPGPINPSLTQLTQRVVQFLSDRLRG
jgi:acetyl esterase/lipase